MIRRSPQHLGVLMFVLAVATTLPGAAAHAHPSHSSQAGGFEYAGLHGIDPQLSDRSQGSAPAALDGDEAELTSVEAATPRASCGPGSHPETGRQGRVPLAEYENGRAAEGYRCNTQLVARQGVTGGYQVHRYVDRTGRECAYYDSTLIWGKDLYKGAQPGVYVLDMSDSARPVRTAVLRTPAMQSPHESLRLNAKRGLLVANMGSPSTYPGFVDIYDVSTDCRYPELRSSLPLALAGHEGGFSPDGRTYWATATAVPGVTAIDVSDPSSPRVLWRTEEYQVHGLSVSADGTRVYLAAVEDYVTTTTQGAGGLVILDVSEVQSRTPAPTVEEVSRLSWPEVSIPQNSIPVTIRGRKHLIQFDEFDTNVFTNDPADVVGGVHIIDIEDEREPRIVSRIRLEVQQQDARATDQQDDPGNQRVGQGYAAHYCSVPREAEPTVLACSMIASGLRVFDIRDPRRPREIAYFNQPLVEGLDPSEAGAYAMSAPAFVPERGEIWYSDVNTGFFNVRLTNHGRALLSRTAASPSDLRPGSDAPDEGGAAVASSAGGTASPASKALPATGGPAPAALSLVALLLGAAGRRALRPPDWSPAPCHR